MASQVIKRISATESGVKINFEAYSGRYLVKNYSDGDIFVSLDVNLPTDQSIKITSGMGQICIINEKNDAESQEKTNALFIKGNGEVEVQQLWY